MTGVVSWLLAASLVAFNPAADEAEAHFAAGEYERAIEALQRAYGADPQPRFIYAEGASLQALGRCEEAIEAYERFLEVTEDADKARTAYDRISECREQLDAKRPEAEPPPAPAPAPTPVAEPAPTPASAAPVASTDQAPWYRDATGSTLLAVGSLAVVGGASIIGIGAARYRDSPRAGSEGEFRTHRAAGRNLQIAGIAVTTVGAGLVIGGIVRFALVRRQRGLAVLPTPGGIAVRF